MTKTHHGLSLAYGGVVVDGQGRVLLREPKNHFDGYAYTFAKGRPDEGETPEEAALREVREETGLEAEIVEPIPGTFAGGTTSNAYFLMRPVRDHGDFDRAETVSVSWVDWTEAEARIGQTTNSKGRARDLAVLTAAFELWRSQPPHP